MLGLCSLSLAIVFCQIGLSRQGVSDSSDCAVNGDGTPNCSTANQNLSPLIILHGITGSKMYVDGHGSNFPSNLASCGAIPSPYSGTFSLKAWVAYALAISDPFDLQKCILYMMSLSYDSASGAYRNRTGMNVTFTARRPFGLTCPMTCLLTDSNQSCNPNENSTSTDVYFGALISHLAQFGYVKGCNLFGAPYDWRLAPQLNEMDAYSAKLKNLIENVFNTTGKKAFILSHSMGNLVTNNFLNQRMTQAWQHQYLNGTIYVSAPLGGSVKTLDALLSGNPNSFLFNGASLIISNSSLRDLVRTFASLAILLPNWLAFQSGTTLVTIQGTAYTVADMANLLALANVPNLATIYQNSASQINAQQYTPMYCVHGNSADSTPQQYAYPNGINSTGTVTKGAGDGTVNIDSLRVCQQWKDQGKLVNQVVEIANVSHEGILHTRQFYDVIDSILIA